MCKSRAARLALIVCNMSCATWHEGAAQRLSLTDLNTSALFRWLKKLPHTIGAVRVFLQSHHSAATCLQHVRSSGPGAVVCKSRATVERLSRASVMLRATWYEGTAQLLSLTELKSHLFELYLIG